MTGQVQPPLPEPSAGPDAAATVAAELAVEAAAADESELAADAAAARVRDPILNPIPPGPPGPEPMSPVVAAEVAVEAAGAAEAEIAAGAATVQVRDAVLNPIPPEPAEPEPPSSIVAAEIALETAGAVELEVAAEAATVQVRDPVLSAMTPELASLADSAEAARAEAGSRPRRRRWPRLLRFLGGFVFGLLGILALSAGGLYAFDLQYSGRILPGVHVGDVDLSGLTASQASARLADAYASLAEGELVLAAGDLSAGTPLADLGRRADVDAMVAEAMAVGRAGDPFQRLVGNARTAARGVVLEPRVTIDRAAVERTVSAFVSSITVSPGDAKVTLEDGAFIVFDGRVGRTVDGPALATRALAALSGLDLPERVVVNADLISIEPVVTTEEASAAMQTAKRMAADIVLTDEAGSWTIPAGQVATWISFEVTGDGGYRPVATPTDLDTQLADIAAAVARPAQSASYLFDRAGNIVGASEGTEGRALDSTATLAAISALLARRATGETAPEIAPAVATVNPELTTEQATATAPLMKKISEWTTYFPIYVGNGYGANIWIPAMDIDGYVVQPGAWFDFWKAIGPITRARGYTDGGAIINGHTEPTGALAGGICSTSTTLFNAALRAGLQMGARENHYYYISRYPLGLDATVWQSSSGSTQSMTFRNDTDYPILIRSYKIRNGSSGYVKFEIYGVPTNRTVSISTPIVKNVQKAVDTTQRTDALPAGTTRRLETPTDGMDVWTTVTVKDASGNVIRSTTYYSHYARVDGIVQIGTG